MLRYRSSNQYNYQNPPKGRRGGGVYILLAFDLQLVLESHAGRYGYLTYPVTKCQVAELVRPVLNFQGLLLLFGWSQVGQI